MTRYKQKSAYPNPADVNAAWESARGMDEHYTGVLSEIFGIYDAYGLTRIANGGPSWAETWRGKFVVPAYDANGTMRSLRAWWVWSWASAPRGYRIGGLVMACPRGLAMLRGEATCSYVTIVEGEPDFIRAVREDTGAVFGVFVGAWTDAHSDRIPADAFVDVRVTEPYIRASVGRLISRREHVFRIYPTDLSPEPWM